MYGKWIWGGYVVRIDGEILQLCQNTHIFRGFGGYAFNVVLFLFSPFNRAMVAHPWSAKVMAFGMWSAWWPGASAVPQQVYPVFMLMWPHIYHGYKQ